MPLPTALERLPLPVLLRAAQLGSATAVVAVITLGVTGGQLLSSEATEGLHGAGAMAHHVASGVAAAALALIRLVAGGPTWPTVLAVVTFGLGFVQASVGETTMLDLHVPGSLVLCATTVWQLAWVLRFRVPQPAPR